MRVTEKTSKRHRSAWAIGLALVAVASLAMTACSSSSKSSGSSSSAASSSSSGTTASAANGGLGDLGKASGGTDVGLTATTMRIAVIADVASPFLPGLFQNSVDAVKAWAKVVNAHGGLAGRKVTVDFIDSKSDPNTTRNAIIQACAQDFAMVGTFALGVHDRGRHGRLQELRPVRRSVCPTSPRGRPLRPRSATRRPTS